jgi:hypothetical protein
VRDLREDRVLRLVAEPARVEARAQAGHPIARSAEPGEDWSWCFVDEVAFVLE